MVQNVHHVLSLDMLEEEEGALDSESVVPTSKVRSDAPSEPSRDEVIGEPGLDQERPAKPEIPWLEEHTWFMCCDLEETLPCFAEIQKDMLSEHIFITLGQLDIRVNPESWEGYESAEDEMKPKEPESIPWDTRLTVFQKLIVVKCFMEEKVVSALTEFVIENLGKQFIENPPVDLATLYQDMSPSTPLVFILSTGSDPMGAFQRFAKERGYSERMRLTIIKRDELRLHE
ncbi:UNVERIFIED_CONTAM: Dynein heavy chain 6, axonemal [Gekko kuhli]